eukprot:96388-Hanusia_phi.AAC.6
MPLAHLLCRKQKKKRRRTCLIRICRRSKRGMAATTLSPRGTWTVPTTLLLDDSGQAESDVAPRCDRTLAASAPPASEYNH